MHILRCASSRTSFKGGDVTVSIHEPHNTIIYLILDSLYFDVFFGIPVSFVYNIPPLHILRCASSRTSFKGGDVTVSIHEPHNTIIYLILDSLYFDVFFGIPVSFVYNIPPLHILRCASSRTSFKGGDVMVSIHEQHSSIIYLIFGLLLVIYTSIFIRLSFALPISFLYRM